MEDSSSCSFDYLELGDPSDGSSIELCGQEGLGYDYVTNGNVATVAFHSDGSENGRGYSLTYEAVDVPGNDNRVVGKNTNIPNL